MNTKRSDPPLPFFLLHQPQSLHLLPTLPSPRPFASPTPISAFTPHPALPQAFCFTNPNLCIYSPPCPPPDLLLHQPQSLHLLPTLPSPRPFASPTPISAFTPHPALPQTFCFTNPNLCIYSPPCPPPGLLLHQPQSLHLLPTLPSPRPFASPTPISAFTPHPALPQAFCFTNPNLCIYSPPCPPPDLLLHQPQSLHLLPTLPSPRPFASPTPISAFTPHPALPQAFCFTNPNLCIYSPPCPPPGLLLHQPQSLHLLPTLPSPRPFASPTPISAFTPHPALPQAFCFTNPNLCIYSPPCPPPDLLLHQPQSLHLLPTLPSPRPFASPTPISAFTPHPALPQAFCFTNPNLCIQLPTLLSFKRHPHG